MEQKLSILCLVCPGCGQSRVQSNNALWGLLGVYATMLTPYLQISTKENTIRNFLSSLSLWVWTSHIVRNRPYYWTAAIFHTTTKGDSPSVPCPLGQFFSFRGARAKHEGRISWKGMKLTTSHHWMERDVQGFVEQCFWK